MSKNKFPDWALFLIIFGSILLLGILLFVWLNSSTSSESLITEFIEGQGYVIISLYSTEEKVTLIMDGKGSTDMQAITGFIGISRSYPDSKEYRVEIRTDTQTCSYKINSATAEKVREDSTILLTESSLMNKFCY